MRIKEIALGLEKTIIQEQIADILKSEGYSVKSVTNKGAKLLRWLLNNSPEFLLIDYKFLGSNISETIKIILEDKICHLGIIVSELEKEKLKSTITNDDYLFYIVKPINKKVFINQVEMIVKSIKQIGSLNNEIDKLKSTIEKRKIIEKAKGMIMEEYSVSEAIAYRMIQKRSMEKRVSMKEIAKKIVEEYT